MASNLNALFPGFESYMDGDIEINNEVTVPEGGMSTDGGDSVDTVSDEIAAEETGTEGAEIEGEAETTEAENEATNMIFDQMLNMYVHVKNFGIDRTFLSLYNRNGQLNSMLGRTFPSFESLDSVGNPNSQLSQAFIAAMEDENGGMFAKIKNWVVSIIQKIYRLILNIINWFKDKFVSTGARITKLKSVLQGATFKDEAELDTKAAVPDIDPLITAMSKGEFKAVNKEISAAVDAARATAKRLKKSADDIKKLEGAGEGGYAENDDISDKTMAGIDKDVDKLKVKVDALKETINAAKQETTVGAVFKKYGNTKSLLKVLDSAEVGYKDLATIRGTLDQFNKDTAELYKFLKSSSEHGRHNWITRNIHGAEKTFRNFKEDAMRWQKKSTYIIEAIRVCENGWGSIVNGVGRYVSFFTK